MACLYCKECLAKFSLKRSGSQICPLCDCSLTRCKNTKIRASLCTRAARKRGLRNAPKKKSWYRLYLESPRWSAIRLRTLDRDSYFCALCAGKAEQVHHSSYNLSVLLGELDDELHSVCRECHKALHNKNKSFGKPGVEAYGKHNVQA